MTESELSRAREDERTLHTFDDDGVCTKCDFDGAEWHWWRYSTYEGRASSAAVPRCSVRTPPQSAGPHASRFIGNGDDS
jgi:hypothetical protein